MTESRVTVRNVRDKGFANEPSPVGPPERADISPAQQRGYHQRSQANHNPKRTLKTNVFSFAASALPATAPIVRFAVA